MVDSLQDPIDEGYRIASRVERIRILPPSSRQQQQPTLNEMVMASTNKVQQLEEEVGDWKKRLVR